MGAQKLVFVTNVGKYKLLAIHFKTEKQIITDMFRYLQTLRHSQTPFGTQRHSRQTETH